MSATDPELRGLDAVLGEIEALRAACPYDDACAKVAWRDALYRVETRVCAELGRRLDEVSP